MEEMRSFPKMTDSFQRHQLEPNRIVRKEHKDGLIPVKSEYQVLSRSRQHEQIWSWKLIWRKKAPY